MDINFSWWVPFEGYKLKDIPGMGVCLVTPANNMKHRKITPLTWHLDKKIARGEVEPEPMFAQFASLWMRDNDAILNFANIFGLLNNDGHTIINDLRIYSLEKWMLAIDDFAPTYHLWLAQNEGRIEDMDKILPGLLRHLQPLDTYRSYIVQNGERVVVANNDRRQVTHAVLAKILNDKVKESCFPQIIINSNGTPEMQLQPVNLIAAIWLQLLQAFIKKRKYKTCARCRRLMDITVQKSTTQYHRKCSINIRQERFRGEPTGKKRGRPRKEQTNV